MNNHRSKLLAIVCLVVWSFGSHVVRSQVVAHSPHNESAVQNILYGMAAKFKKRAKANKSAAVKKAYIHGWPITKKLAGGGFKELQMIGPDGVPLYKETYNEMVVKTARADYLSEGTGFDFGVDGSQMTLGIWDSGKVLPDHQEFTGRISAGDRSPRVSGHATHVMGTALASGVDPRAKGVAYNATGISFDWNNDEGEAAEQAAEGLLISNHSYGLSGRNLPDWYFGSYIHQAQDWDEIMHAAPYYLMVTAAGNTRYLHYNDSPLAGTPSDGYDLLLGFALSKNGITVAAADNIAIDGKGDLLSADIASFSNFGPSDDGRIKPDITGAGVDVYSSYDKKVDSYRVLSGTSMASPGVAASLLLLQQYHYVAHGNYMRAATLKGLALHTADEAGEHPGPDPKFGWGVLNVKRAAETIDADEVNSRIEELTLGRSQEYTLTVHAEAGVTLAVSLSWTDPAYPEKFQGKANDSTPVLVNDLDLRVFKNGEPYYPWKLRLSDLQGGAVKGDNRVDPYEKIEIGEAEGEYTIVVSHKGQLAGTSQDFSLIVTGISTSDCAIVVPKKPLANDIGQDSASIIWEPVDDAFYEVRYKSDSEVQWTTQLLADNTLDLANLIADTQYSVQVRSLCSELMGSEYSEVLAFRTAEPTTEEETNTGETGNTTDPDGNTDGTGSTDNPADSGTGDEGNGTDGSGSTDTGSGSAAGSDPDGSGSNGSGEGTNPDGSTDGTGSTDNPADSGTGDEGSGTDGSGSTDTGSGSGTGSDPDGSGSNGSGEGTNPDGSTDGTGSTDNSGDSGTGDEGSGTDGSGSTDTGSGSGTGSDPDGSGSNGSVEGTNPDGSTDGTGSTDNSGSSGTGDEGNGTDESGSANNPGGEQGGSSSGSEGGYPGVDEGNGGFPEYPEVDGPPYLEPPIGPVDGVDPGDGQYGDAGNGSLNSDEDPDLVWTPSGDAIVIVGGNSRMGPYYLVDLLGRILRTGDDASQPIPVSGLSKGFYILAFEVDGTYLAKKFAK